MKTSSADTEDKGAERTEYMSDYSINLDRQHLVQANGILMGRFPFPLDPQSMELWHLGVLWQS